MDIDQGFYKLISIVILLDLFLVMLSYTVISTTNTPQSALNTSQNGALAYSYTNQQNIVNNVQNVSGSFTKIYAYNITKASNGQTFGIIDGLAGWIGNFLSNGINIVWQVFVMVINIVLFTITTVVLIFTLVNGLQIGFLAIPLDAIIGVLFTAGAFFTVMLLIELFGKVLSAFKVI